MKNTIKVHRNNGKASHPSQAKTRSDKVIQTEQIRPQKRKIFRSRRLPGFDYLRPNTQRLVERDVCRGLDAQYTEPGGDHFPKCLAVYDRASKGPLEKISLTDDESDLLFSIAVRPEHFVADAVRQKLADEHQGTRKKLVDALWEVEESKNQAIAMMQLMFDSEAHHMSQGDLTDDFRDTVNAGVSLLMLSTQDRLEAAFNAVHAAAHAGHLQDPRAAIDRIVREKVLDRHFVASDQQAPVTG